VGSQFEKHVKAAILYVKYSFLLKILLLKSYCVRVLGPVWSFFLQRAFLEFSRKACQEKDQVMNPGGVPSPSYVTFVLLPFHVVTMAVAYVLSSSHNQVIILSPGLVGFDPKIQKPRKNFLGLCSIVQCYAKK
jgi:hypothetical protein